MHFAGSGDINWTVLLRRSNLFKLTAIARTVSSLIAVSSYAAAVASYTTGTYPVFPTNTPNLSGPGIELANYPACVVSHSTAFIKSQADDYTARLR